MWRGRGGGRTVRNVQLERRRKSTVSKLDDALLVVAAIVAAVVVFSVVSWVLHAVFLLVKLAVAAVVFGLIARAVINRR